MAKMFHRAGLPASGQKVFLASPAYRDVGVGYAYAMFHSSLALAKAGIAVELAIFSGDCHVDDARNRLVRDFLAGDCTDLVFLDTDMRWEPRDLVALCQYDRDVVGATYPLKQEEAAYPVLVLDDDADWSNTWSDEVDGLIEVDGLPTGFLRIRRHVLEKLAADAEEYFGKRDSGASTPLIFERSLTGTVRWGGDYTFCRKWRDAGGKIHLMPNVNIEHTGEWSWGGSFAETLRRKDGTTLRYAVDQIKTGSIDPSLFREARRYANNLCYGAREDVLTLCAVLARQAKGPIIEAGSGLSTIVMAAATDQPVYCLEHDPEWAEQLATMIEEAGVTGIALCLCPIKNGWYDLTDYPDLPSEFALGLNDGPPRTLANRMGFYECFGECTDTIIVDDADDDSYGDAIKAWCAEHQRRVDFFPDRAALIRHEEPSSKEKAHAAA